MSRRRGQNGFVEQSGLWFYVRYRIDTPNGRQYRRERLCPVSGPGSLTASERTRKAKELVAASGADTSQCLEASRGVTFGEQAAVWLETLRTRKRKPLAPSTLIHLACTLDKWLLPAFGETPLSAVDNDTVRDFIAMLAEKGLAPKTIANYFQPVRAIIASAKDAKTRKPLHPVVWDFEYLDLPAVVKERQKRPCFTSETVDAIITASDGWHRMLYLILAATGLRIGEALGLTIESISPDCSTISVTQKVYSGVVQERLKTENGRRQVDLHSTVAAELRAFIDDRKTRLLFCTKNGKPLQVTGVRLHLAGVLEKLGGPAGAPFHAFRRYRTTWLRKQRVQEDIVRFWLGHSGKSITDDYSHVSEDTAYRKRAAERAGTGLSFAPIAPSSETPHLRERLQIAGFAQVTAHA